MGIDVVSYRPGGSEVGYACRPQKSKGQPWLPLW